MGFYADPGRVFCLRCDRAWLRLSDLVSIVGFFAVIRQLCAGDGCGCRILCGYPTTTRRILSRLSDSLRLSDNHAPDLVSVVGFFAVIRQPCAEDRCGCRILSGYPTTICRRWFRLSDSLRLSDNPKHFLFSVTFAACCHGCAPLHNLFCELYQHPERMFGITYKYMFILFNLFNEIHL